MIAAHEKVLADPVGFRILDSRFHARLSTTAGNVVLERIAYGLYNMGLDVRRRATREPRADPAKHRRPYPHRRSDRCPRRRPRRGRDGRPSRPHRGDDAGRDGGRDLGAVAHVSGRRERGTADLLRQA